MNRLLLITSEFPPQPGGIGNHAHNVAKYLSKHNFAVTVLADFRSENRNEDLLFDAKQPYSVRRIERKYPILRTYFKRMAVAQKLLKSHDIILVSGKFPIWVGGWLSLFTRKNIYAVIHGSEVASPSFINKNFTNWCLSRFVKIIAVSNFTKSLVNNESVKNIEVIYNGFEMKVPKKTAKTPILPLRIITVGNITQRKGQHNIIKALPLLLKKYPDLKYDIVGLPTERDSLEILAKSLEVVDTIVFHGKVSEEKKVNLLQKATIFMMLSELTNKGDVEGFGIAIIEANALGVPAIGAVGCGIEDAIINYRTGILVNPKDSHAIRDAIDAIINSYHQYSKEAEAWSAELIWPKVIEKYIKILK